MAYSGYSAGRCTPKESNAAVPPAENRILGGGKLVESAIGGRGYYLYYSRLIIMGELERWRAFNLIVIAIIFICPNEIKAGRCLRNIESTILNGTIWSRQLTKISIFNAACSAMKFYDDVICMPRFWQQKCYKVYIAIFNCFSSRQVWVRARTHPRSVLLRGKSSSFVVFYHNQYLRVACLIITLIHYC